MPEARKLQGPLKQLKCQGSSSCLLEWHRPPGHRGDRTRGSESGDFNQRFNPSLECSRGRYIVLRRKPTGHICCWA